jgi:hypothetical protein
LEFPVKPFIAAVFVLAMGVLVSGCASGTAAPAGGGTSSTASSGSGVTVFGTIDAGVSGYSTRSERR